MKTKSHGTTIPGLTINETATIKTFIKQHLKDGQVIDVWLFGSRATGKHRRYSDVDLLICSSSTAPFSPVQVHRLREAFEDSDLPYKVDLVLEDELAEPYRASIEASKQPLFLRLSPNSP
jgi:predicted nucleotidyltransferase